MQVNLLAVLGTGAGGATVHCCFLMSPDIKFLSKAAQNRDSGLALNTSGFNCNRLEAVIVEVIVFLPFCNLRCCSCKMPT